MYEKEKSKIVRDYYNIIHNRWKKHCYMYSILHFALRGEHITSVY